jgi:hypothetical protein
MTHRRAIRHKGLLLLLIAAMLLPWCQVTCGAAPNHHHAAAHQHSLGLSDDHDEDHALTSTLHDHLPFSFGLECNDDEQGIAVGIATALDDLTKQLPLFIAIAAAFWLILFNFPLVTSEFSRYHSTAGPPVRRHLLFCVIRD